MQTIIESSVGHSSFRVNGESHLMVEIQDQTGKVTHQVSANAVLKMLRDVEKWQYVADEWRKACENERNKICRLMACLTDEVLK